MKSDLYTSIKAKRDGSFKISWGTLDTPLISTAMADMREKLVSDSPAVSRLFPAAYGADDEKNAGWDMLARSELVDRRLETIAVVENLLGRDTADADEINAFMRAVNDVRLILGSRLDVQETGPPPDLDESEQTMYAIYEVFGQVLYQALKALGGSL